MIATWGSSRKSPTRISSLYIGLLNVGDGIRHLGDENHEEEYVGDIKLPRTA